MNAAFLLMSSAALTGADPAPAHPAPVVISSGSGCTNCGTPAHSDCGNCGRAGLLDRLKSRFGSRKSHDCGCAPCAPAPAPCAPTCAPACDPCKKSYADRPNLFDTLRAKWGAKKSCGPTCDPCGASHLGAGCATPLPAGAAPVTPPAGGGAPPKEMPKPKDPPKSDAKPKGEAGAPGAPGVNRAGLTAPNSPY